MEDRGTPRSQRYTVRMDVYDFDGTLYKGDSTRDFTLWCARRHPRAALTLPRAGAAAVACFGLKRMEKTRFKADLYRYLQFVPHIEQELEAFWKAHEANIAGPCRAKPGDLVISASPDFLLRDVCEKRGLALIASQVDAHTGAILGPNCSNEEKVRRYREQYADTPVERFYSDSHNDDPMAALATRAYLVNIPRCTVVPWP